MSLRLVTIWLALVLSLGCAPSDLIPRPKPTPDPISVNTRVLFLYESADADLMLTNLLGSVELAERLEKKLGPSTWRIWDYSSIKFTGCANEPKEFQTAWEAADKIVSESDLPCLVIVGRQVTKKPLPKTIDDVMKLIGGE